MDLDASSQRGRRVADSFVYTPSSSSTSNTGRLGIMAMTDGVHHRLQGGPKVSILPPKIKSRDGSTSSLEESKDETSNEKDQRKRLQRLGHSEGYDEDKSVLRRALWKMSRKFHSTTSVDCDVDRDAEQPSPCSSNTTSSTHSLSQDPRSESDLYDESGAGENIMSLSMDVAGYNFGGNLDEIPGLPKKN